MKLILLLAVVAVSALSCGGGSDRAVQPTGASASSAGWTMLAHDVRSSFRAGESLAVTDASRLREAWRFSVSGSVNGTVAIVGDRIYALATGGLYALNAADGSVIWQNGEVKGTSSPTFVDGKLFVSDSRSVLHCLDAATGAEEWRAVIDTHPRASAFSSPVVAGGRVIVGSASIEEAVAKDSATFRGSLVAFDRETGAEAWRRYTVDPPYNGVAIWSSPSVDADLGLVFADTGNNYTGDAGPTSDSIFALDLETGELRWWRQLTQGDVFTIPSPRSPDSDFGTNPVLFEAEVDGQPRRLLGAGQKSGMYYALDRETGEVVWRRKLGGGSALIGGVFNNGAYDGTRLLVAVNNSASDAPGGEPSNGYSKSLGVANTTTSVLMALDPATGGTLWERQLPAWVWAPITIAGEVGFVSADRDLQAFDVTTGAKLSSFPTDGTISSGAAIAGGRVVFGSGLSYLGTTPDKVLHALTVAD